MQTVKTFKKYVLLSIAILILTSCSSNKTFIEDDSLENESGKKELFVKNKITYNKVTGTPYSGKEVFLNKTGKLEKELYYKFGDIHKVIHFYKIGSKKSEISYKNGFKDGISIFWDENGKKTLEEIYVKGKLNRKAIFKDMKKVQEDAYNEKDTISWYFYDNHKSKTIVFDKDGKKKSERNFKSNIKNGDFFVYYTNANKKSESFYKNGKKIGKEILYYENGNKKSEVEYKEDKKEGKFISWYENGNKESELEYKDDKKEGLSTLWHENGNKKLETSYKNDLKDGKETVYYENGNKKSKLEYIEGKKEGKFISWYENKKKKFEINYKDDSIDETKKNLFWNEKGKKEKFEESMLEEKE